MGNVPRQLLGYPPGHIREGRLSYVSASSVSIGTAGKNSSARDDADLRNIDWTGALAVDITLSGAGGLDTGTEVADAWYAVHVIADSNVVNPVAAMLSLSASAPTLPSGYDQFRRLGWVRNKTSNFIRFAQTGIGSERIILYDVSSVQTVLQNGLATDFTAVDLSEFIPPTSQWALCHFEFLGSSSSSDFGIRPTGFVNALRFTAPLVFQPSFKPVGQEARQVLWTMTDESQSIDYILSSSTSELDIAPAGWRECL